MCDMRDQTDGRCERDGAHPAECVAPTVLLSQYTSSDEPSAARADGSVGTSGIR